MVLWSKEAEDIDAALDSESEYTIILQQNFLKTIFIPQVLSILN